jgi:hypothetical protein
VDATIVRAYALMWAFLVPVREDRGDDQEARLTEATHNGIEVAAGGARGLQADLVAVKVELTLDGATASPRARSIASSS